MPDMPTMLLLLALGGAVLGTSVLLVAARTEHYPGLATWGAALLVNSLSHVAFGLRLLDWPKVSIVASNALMPLSMALFISAVLRFHRLPAPPAVRALMWAAVPLGVLVALLALDLHRIRNLVVVCLHVLLMLAMAWVAWHRPHGKARVAGHILIMAGALGMALVFLWRAALMIGQADWPGPLFVPPVVQVVTYLMVFVALLTNTLGFVLMQMEHAIERQHELATHDPLTDALNRRALLEAMERLAGLSQRQGQPLSVLMIDIDHFKRVNDSQGHAGGDAVLKEVARRLQGRLRKSDLLARFGGEEFLVLLPDTGPEQAARVAESLRASIPASAIRLPGQATSLEVTVSIGVHSGVAGKEPGQVEKFISASDAAMYQAKSQGRNRVAVSGGEVG